MKGAGYKERRSMSADAHGRPMSGASAHFIASSWASANTFRRSLDLNLTRMPEGASAEPRGYVTASLRDGLR